MGTKTGELRQVLIDAIGAVKNGSMKPDQAKSIAMLAGQVNLSLQVELNIMREQLAYKVNGTELPELGDGQLGVRDVPALPAPEPAIGEPRLVHGRAASGSK